MRVMFPIAIRASEILNVDADLRPKWQDILDNLLPVPPSPQPGEYYDICTPVSDDTALFNSLKALTVDPAAAGAATAATLASFPANPLSPPTSAWANLSRRSFPARCIPTPKPTLPLAAGASCEIA